MESKPEPKSAPMTLSKFRELRGKFFTIRQEAVEPCGHPMGVQDEPQFSNCQHCWYAYFSQHTELVLMVGKLMALENGVNTVTRARGKKFVKMFQRFVKTLERLKEVTYDTERTEDDVSGSGGSPFGQTIRRNDIPTPGEPSEQTGSEHSDQPTVIRP
jgi:hypothetical protein